MDKIKVLQVTSGLSTEGIGTFVLNTYENINKEKVSVSFALATDWTQHHEHRIIESGGKIYRTAEIGRGIPGIVKHFTNLIKLLKKEGPFDVVHSHMDFFNGLNVLAAFLAGVPIRISHAHKAVNKEYLRFTKRLYNVLMKILISVFSTHKIGCSTIANEYMHTSKWNIHKNSQVLLNGIDLNKFSFDINYNKYLINFNIKKTNLNLITIGRIDEPKNPFFIVEVIKELKKIRNNIHLYWVGSGSLEEKVKGLVTKYNLAGDITFLGVRDDVPEILKNMDYMLFPSKWEGLGIVLVEAQALRVPCFISDNISNEVNLGLCKTISLNKDAGTWALEINDFVSNQTNLLNIDEKKLYKFDIRNTTKELEKIYGAV